MIDLEPITVDQARKILGAKVEDLTDKQVSALLNTLRLLCDKQIEGIIEIKENEDDSANTK